MLLLRKLASFTKKVRYSYRSFSLKLRCSAFQDGISFAGSVYCAEGVSIACTDGGEIYFGSNVSLCSNVRIIAQGGRVVIGDNSHIGEGTIITSKQSVTIGQDALIAEYVVIRDQDHNLESDPVRQAGFTTAPIVIEDNVWLAAKSTVLKGVHIGAGAVVAAHALVNKDIAARAIVAGVPACKVSSR